MTNEPIASPPSATTGMTKRALRIVPPSLSESMEVLPPLLVNPSYLSRRDLSCRVRASKSSDLVVQLEEGGVELWRPGSIRNDLDAEVAVTVHIERLD